MEPKLDTIAQDIRSHILAKYFGEGGCLPPVVQLASKYCASRKTVYAALALLISENLLIARDGTYYVRPPKLHVPSMACATFKAFLLMHGERAWLENLCYASRMDLPSDVQHMFGLQEEGMQVVHRKVVQGLINDPYRISETYYVADFVSVDFIEAMNADPRFRAQDSILSMHDLNITRQQEDVIARLPTEEEASILQISRTTPVCEIRRSNYAEGLLIMLARNVYIGSKFILRYPLLAEYFVTE